MAKRKKKVKRMWTGKPIGNSKYAKKVKARKRLAHSLGYSDLPYPILWIILRS